MLDRSPKPKTGRDIPTPDLQQGLLSLRRQTEDDRERGLYEYALDTLDFRLYAELWAMHGSESPKNWFHLPRYLQIAYRRIATLGLNRCEPIDLIDLACGAGYECHVARYFGHRAIGLDKSKHDICSDLDRLLGNERISQTIAPMVPLNIERRFDLITAFNASFHTRKTGDWTPDEWAFFIDDLRQNQLKDRGRVYLVMNDHPWKGDGFFEMLKRQGVIFDGKAIKFR